jgi:hypothetical protein
MTKVRTTMLIVAVTCACGTLAAQQPKEPASVAECAAIESAVARLDCFDALARKERGGDASAPEKQSDAPRRSNAESQDEGSDAARISRRDTRAADRERRELTSQVVALREIQPERVEVTLANGQVWRQTNADRYNLLVGHEVRLYPSGFGRYFRLSSTKARGFIQVERVR